jgi:diguanylate cyclase (GGDEF)-like protein/PAS domain S-box-containing protein
VDKVQFELARLLLMQSRAAVLGAALTATALFIGLYHVLPTFVLSAWYSLMIISGAVRWRLINLFVVAKPDEEMTKQWYQHFMIATWLSAVLWAFAGTVMMPQQPVYQVLVIFVIAGVVAASATCFAPNRLLAAGFILLIMPIFGLHMLVQHHLPQQIVGFLSLVYGGVLILTAQRSYAALQHSLQLRFHNHDLIDQLSASAKSAELMNQSLQREIHERLQAEQLLRSSEEQYRLITDALPVLIAFIDKDGIFRFNNKAYETWFHRPVTEMTGRSIQAFFSETAYQQFQEHFQAVLLNQQIQYETTMQFNEEERYVSVTLIPHQAAGEINGAFSLMSDVTPRINYLATHDSLTGLPNRSLLHARLTNAIKNCERHNRKVAVLFLDLDHFKEVNDTLGHDVGDQLLIIVAERLKSCLSKHDTIARLGGDEFVVILEDMNLVQSVSSVAERICKVLAEVYKLNGNDVFVTTSVGISLFPDDGTDMQVLLKNADMAMYRAKSRGRHTYEFYTKGMNEAIKRKSNLENQLRQAVSRDELMLYYQPVVDVKTKRIISLEALCRWQHAELGAISPSEFIPIAEASDLIVKLGNWVMETACRQHVAWQQAGLPPVRISINLSARQFMQRELAENMASMLQRVGMEGNYLTLELTETLIMQNADYTLATARALKSLGITLAIDDFGVGYSNLSYLKLLPFDFIKIDRSFITDFQAQPDDATIVSAMIGLAHRLNMRVIGEGVEQREQYRYLTEQGCDEIQGYLLFQPMPRPEVEVLLEHSLEHLRPDLLV